MTVPILLSATENWNAITRKKKHVLQYVFNKYCLLTSLGLLIISTFPFYKNIFTNVTLIVIK